MNLPTFLFNRFFHKYPNRRPHQTVAVDKINLADMLDPADPKAAWFGHSTVFMQIAGKTILCDPIFYNMFWFFSIFMGKRFTEDLPLQPQEFPEIDVLLLSHDHYDHMDRHSIMAVQNKVKRFLVPHGLGKRLRDWNIPSEKIREMSYGETATEAGIEFTCTPNHHFSGRSIFDRNKTLWCSWVIATAKNNVFFSGDGAYGSHFKNIGEKYGPFDFVCMECGQASKFTSEIHMVPEKAVQAEIDLQGKLMLPIHWGMFSQSNNDWTQQVSRLVEQAQTQNVDVATPQIGELINIGNNNYPHAHWWEELQQM